MKPADEEWGKTQWFPRALASGWKHWAVVTPETVLGQMNMRRWIELYAQAGIHSHPAGVSPSPKCTKSRCVLGTEIEKDEGARFRMSSLVDCASCA